MAESLKSLTERVQTAAGMPEDQRDGNWGAQTAQSVLKALGAPAVIIKPPMPTPKDRDINERGLSLVKYFEGLYLKAYRDEVGVWTIGYGHTGLQHQDGTVFAGRVITKDEADRLLRYDMNQFEARVMSFAKVPLSDDEFSALVSFDFNTGGLGNSTLLRLLNAGDRKGAHDQFARWNKAGGRVLNGLTKRRTAEAALFAGDADLHLRLDRRAALGLSENEQREAGMTPDSPDAE